MGRLRFTLTNIMFWIVIILSCLLTENIAIFSDSPRSGFEDVPLYVLTFAIIGLLIFYYFLEHKKNGLTLDKILLPCFIMFGALMIWTIFRQGDRTFVDWSNEGTFSISFTYSERLLASLQVVIWLGALYAMVFVYNRFRLNLESYRWIPKIYLILVLVFCLVDLFYEWDIIAEIFVGTYTGGGVQFLLGNPNVFGLVIFTGILSGVILSYKRFSWYYFVAMVAMFCYLILTTSATAIYISLIVMILYPVYEILSLIRRDRKKGFKVAIIYVCSIGLIVGLSAIFINIGVPIFANFWSFVDAGVLHKDFLTITGRTSIWTHIIDLLKQNPLDFIFGLGHQTGSKIFQTYNFNHMAVKSAHNAVMEIFLRYGLLGAVLYVGMLILVLVCLALHIKHKRYRFAIVYGLAYLGVLAHSVAESTNIFTSNIGGTYLGLYFALPIMNILQSKKFKEIKDDVSAVPVTNEKFPRCFILFSILYAAIDVMVVKVIYNAFGIDIFSCLVIYVFLLMACLFVLSLKKKTCLGTVNSIVLRHYLKRLGVMSNEK